MVRSLAFLCIFLIALNYSCEPGAGMGDIDHNSLVGDWNWVMQTDASVINGTPYDTLTPVSTGITRKLSLHGDSTYLMLTTAAPNQQQSESGRYKMKGALTPGGPISFLDFVHSGVDSIVNHILSNDSLYIARPLFTGKYIVNIYTRKTPL